jgi:mannose-6-phosphate isomerase-like protein (cupin superfamily)
LGKELSHPQTEIKKKNNRRGKMFIKVVESCIKFQAEDGTQICELLHSERDGINLPYSIALASLHPGSKSISHRLKSSSEVYYILEGEGVVHIDGEQAQIKPGQAIIIPPGSWQHLCNTGRCYLKFLCIVYPFWRKEDEEVKSIS